jgi:hypothetical protein
VTIDFWLIDGVQKHHELELDAGLVEANENSASEPARIPDFL